MNYAWMDEHCLSKKAVQKDFKEEWQGGDKYGKPVATVKLEPEFGRFLRQQYKDIVPGYYMNKEHWNSLYLEGDVPDEVFKDMLDRSYGIVLSSLPKSIRKELGE